MYRFQRSRHAHGAGIRDHPRPGGRGPPLRDAAHAGFFTMTTTQAHPGERAFLLQPDEGTEVNPEITAAARASLSAPG